MPDSGVPGCPWHSLIAPVTPRFSNHVPPPRTPRDAAASLSVRDAAGAPLPEEAAGCFAALADRTFETTAAAILPGALEQRYDPEHFFVEASFTDSEIAVVRAPPAP
jgi:hypothetical protein